MFQEFLPWRTWRLGGYLINLGNDLLSQLVTKLVPSALVGLTTVFGMGTGVSPPVRSPKTFVLTTENTEVTEKNFF